MRRRRLKQWDSSLIHNVEQEKQDVDVTQKQVPELKMEQRWQRTVALVLHCLFAFDFGYFFFSTRQVQEAE